MCVKGYVIYGRERRHITVSGQHKVYDTYVVCFCILYRICEFSMKIKKINPIAKVLLLFNKQVVQNKKGKGSYKRKERNEKSRAK